MIKSRIFGLALIGLGWTFGISTGSAAEIQLLGAERGTDANSKPVSRISLSGEIVKGDLDTLRGIVEPIERAQERPFFGGETLIHLDSDGGDYGESLRLAAYIRETGIGTRMTKDSVCLSACALVFMHGIALDPDGGESLDRTIEPGARLGFNAPSLSLPAKGSVSPSLTAEQVENAYAQSLGNIAQLLQSGSGLIGMDLVATMLATPPDGMTYIETFGDLMTWKIGLIEGPVLAQSGLERMALACRNLWQIEEGTRPDESPDSISVEPGSYTAPVMSGQDEDGSKWYDIMTDEASGSYCVFRVTEKSGSIQLDFHGFTQEAGESFERPAYGSTLDPLFFQDPAAPVVSSSR